MFIKYKQYYQIRILMKMKTTGEIEIIFESSN